MAEHKVPQDVEADDKLIGPFSFRQFVYLMIAAGAGFLMFILGQIAVPLAFIPLPVAAFFLVLALPLRKDQPMEIYLSALVKYYFKPRVRIWQADGEQPFVEISNPTTDDVPKTKDLASDEVSRRLSFLANLSDTQGWSTRGLSAPANNTNLNDDFANDAVNAEDIMGDNALSNSIDNMLDKSERQARQHAIDAMNQATVQQVTPPSITQPISTQPAVAMPTAPQMIPQPTIAVPTAPVQPVANVQYQSVSVVPTNDYTTIMPTTRSPYFQTAAPQPRHNQLSTQPTQPQQSPVLAPQVAPTVSTPATPPATQSPASAKPAIMSNDQPQAPAVDSTPQLTASDNSVIDIKLH